MSEDPQPLDARPPQLKPARELKPLPINYVPMREMDKIDSRTFAQNRTAFNAMGRIKPLQPNTLDIADAEKAKELAEQRRKAGHKWVKVMPNTT
jgi:hypothetical protein